LRAQFQTGQTETPNKHYLKYQGGEARTKKTTHELDKQLIQLPFSGTSYPARLFALLLLTIFEHVAK